MNYKESQKGLKGPDLFQLKVYQAIDWMRKNQKKVAIIITPVLGVVIFGVAFQFIQAHLTQSRAAALGNIDTLYAEGEEKAQKEREKLQEELQRMEGKSEGKDEKASPASPTASPQEIEAKKKQIEDIKADQTIPLKQYQEFYTANISTPEGWRAGLSVAQEALRQKKFQDAQNLVKQILAESTGVDFYQEHVRLFYISILEELRLFDEALKECETLISLADDTLKPQALLVKGRFLLLAEKKEDALKVFDDLLTRYNSSPEAQRARAFKAVL